VQGDTTTVSLQLWQRFTVPLYVEVDYELMIYLTYPAGVNRRLISNELLTLLCPQHLLSKSATL